MDPNTQHEIKTDSEHSTSSSQDQIEVTSSADTASSADAEDTKLTSTADTPETLGVVDGTQTALPEKGEERVVGEELADMELCGETDTDPPSNIQAATTALSPEEVITGLLAFH